MPLEPTAPYKTGQDILAALAKPPEPKIPVVDELLYRKKVTMIAAGPGLGKSTLAIQLCLEATAALPVFKTFHVPKPCRVFYIGFETDWDEFVFALHKLKDHLAFNAANFCFDDELLGLDITEAIMPNDKVIARIKGAKPDIIVVDPLYVAVSGDVADGAVASKAMKWMLMVAVKCNAAVLLLHHTHRERYAQNGKKINEDDDSYGSRWIKANVVIQYNVKEHTNGTAWKLTKDRYKQSRKEMLLAYDHETGLSSAEKSKTTVRDEVMHYIQAHKPGSTFTYPGLAELFHCAEGYLSHMMVEPQFRRLVRKEAPPGKPVTLIRLDSPVVPTPAVFTNSVIPPEAAV